MAVAPFVIMNRQYRAVTIRAIALVAAFVASLTFHSLVGAVTVLLSGVAISYVMGISWMRTRQPSLPEIERREMREKHSSLS